MAIQPEMTAGSSRQRVLVLALAGVLLVVLVVLVARPLLLGGTQTPAGGPPVTVGATPTTRAQLIDPSTSTAGPPAGTTKDPFRPVVAAGGTDTTGSTATTAATTTTTTTGTATVSGSGATAEREVALEDVYTRSGKRYVTVSVDGTSYTATEGERFADEYRVLDIGGACATFESGPARFTLCESEAILK
jgi:hypothetical protein